MVVKMIVHDGSGGAKAYTGYITIGDLHYRLAPDSVLSRLFFRARDTTGAPAAHPVTKAPVWDPKGYVDRFFASPAAYFQFRNPRPDPVGEEGDEQYLQDVADWQARQQAFVREHAAWFEARNDLLHNPPTSEQIKA